MQSTIQRELEKAQITFELNGAISTTLLKAFAELTIIPKRIDQVPKILSILATNGNDYHIHGGGSKSLLLGTHNSPLKTPVIDISKLNGVEVDARTGIIKAMAGSSISRVSRMSADSSLTGLEFARDIPGSTAGAVATEAWHPIHKYKDLFDLEKLEFSQLIKYLKDILVIVNLTNEVGDEISLTADGLEMRNKSSLLLKPGNTMFLLSAVFQLAEEDPELIEKARAIISAGRKRMRARNKQLNPHSVGKTLGYTFVSEHSAYKKSSAADLIKTSDLPKTLNFEGMHHSNETPNIISNTGNGTPQGYLKIAEIIRKAVFVAHNIELPLEIKIVK
ncbi:MAG: hypothetical protein COZ34_02350 [Candidatus Pacebacteria bacterium CG_4_10_14_3_um_filter_34_15]|nr:FAD-binding protein [Candidatus Pacearchaeota archaeon]NCQ65884.1 FAD-binding protein [Candidatus Paceibacterota bacterium]OIO44509.1 MAG: hypothetical protein AUJ41_02570 [Candidatus Pacebacteria bacterium CG1_02_43_31]PIQ80621.1 MAG: hypothetical protein COV78_04645 [Candidatus Pacebacteria bacterium CG11_big_fil_rev_8_21_14_0_20_34_55]PIX81621.1 MAG: hypothetical protein COZ34_02350 [Candidatus Pacebacteria bacterium CG_4_10_14_3_um_filter_34_15]PJC43608.1 MAG: hypothetical protein CO039